MSNNSQKFGKDGEELAKRYLVQRGYRIIACNWRYKKYEVDLVAEINRTIVFIEVKTRKNNTFGEPEVFVTRQKQNFLIAAAHQYMIENTIDQEARFDIISIRMLNNNQIVKHLEGAFSPQVK